MNNKLFFPNLTLHCVITHHPICHNPNHHQGIKIWVLPGNMQKTLRLLQRHGILAFVGLCPKHTVNESLSSVHSSIFR